MLWQCFGVLHMPNSIPEIRRIACRYAAFGRLLADASPEASRLCKELNVVQALCSILLLPKHHLKTKGEVSSVIVIFKIKSSGVLSTPAPAACRLVFSSLLPCVFPGASRRLQVYILG